MLDKGNDKRKTSRSPPSPSILILLFIFILLLRFSNPAEELLNQIPLLHLPLLAPLLIDQDNPPLVIQVLPRVPLLPPVCLQPPQILTMENYMLPIFIPLPTPSPRPVDIGVVTEYEIGGNGTVALP